MEDSGEETSGSADAEAENGLIKSNKQTKAATLIALLNLVIRGWAYYHRYVASSSTFSKVDSAIFDSLWRWARRRHRNKSSRWTYKKYFERLDGLCVFRERARSENGKPLVTKLFRAGSLPIIRHVKIRGDANPYDPRWEAYFERRLDLKMEANPRRRQQLLRLWISQRGLCTECGHKITRMTGWRSHKVVWRVLAEAIACATAYCFIRVVTARFTTVS